MEHIGPGTEINSTIRPATLRDVGAMAIILERANARREGQPLESTLQDISSIVDLRGRMAKQGAWAYLTAVENRPGGFVMGYPSSEADAVPTEANADYLALLMIEPDFWGRGLGGALLEHAADRASAGVQQLSLWTAATNRRARQLYERHGYRSTDLSRTSERQGHLVHYVLKLAARRD